MHRNKIKYSQWYKDNNLCTHMCYIRTYIHTCVCAHCNALCVCTHACTHMYTHVCVCVLRNCATTPVYQCNNITPHGAEHEAQQ